MNLKHFWWKKAAWHSREKQGCVIRKITSFLCPSMTTCDLERPQFLHLNNDHRDTYVTGLQWGLNEKQAHYWLIVNTQLMVITVISIFQWPCNFPIYYILSVCLLQSKRLMAVYCTYSFIFIRYGYIDTICSISSLPSFPFSFLPSFLPELHINFYSLWSNCQKGWCQS